ncbi:MgtC/SapB family protein [Calothrix sp. UHCC 0171]|uniref:MgtC/SapB family protein n=1 Tax=Calothrix sp. UHCC 0171 TaxID=3110245 RepID=UPI002B20209B|nr:MgtC/SapB family protein [Calothrix sp. UHCC 0171]MEA5572868.1 MgtC/SapB family protein [Calothrix sp. UHCC 0171]
MTTYQLTLSDCWHIFVRLSIALIAGAIIGWERQVQHKPAGLRTHMLVSLGSALFTLIPLLISQRNSGVDGDVLSRIVQGITAGVGFLGAGEILRASSEDSQHIPIRGLTSAAAIWVSASLGSAAGCGLWQLTLIGAVLCVVVLSIVKRFE